MVEVCGAHPTTGRLCGLDYSCSQLFLNSSMNHAQGNGKKGKKTGKKNKKDKKKKKAGKKKKKDKKKSRKNKKAR